MITMDEITLKSLIDVGSLVNLQYTDPFASVHSTFDNMSWDEIKINDFAIISYIESLDIVDVIYNYKLSTKEHTIQIFDHESLKLIFDNFGKAIITHYNKFQLSRNNYNKLLSKIEDYFNLPIEKCTYGNFSYE